MLLDPVQIGATNIEQPDLVNIDLGEPLAAPLADPAITSRAAKAAYATGKPADLLANSIADGTEHKTREQTSAEIDYKRQAEAHKAISEVAQRAGGPLTSQEIQTIYATLDRNKQFSNPKSVFEEEFSKKYLNILYGNSPAKQGTWFDDALREVPEYVKDAVDLGTGYLAKDEYLRTKYQDVEAEANAQTWGGYFTDKAKEFGSFGLYSENKLRLLGRSLGVPELKGGLGTNQEAIRIALYRLPLPEFTDKVDTLLEDLKKDNPSLAVEFVSNLLGKSNREISGANLGTALTVGLLPGTGTLVNATRRALMGKTNRAVEDMVRSAMDAGPTQDKILSEAWIKSVGYKGAGNVEEAGIQTATHNLVNDLSGKTSPVQQAVETLPRFLKIQEENLRAYPGADGQEVANRLAEQSVTSKNNILSVISNILRVNRIPAPLAGEQGLRLFWDNIKDKYPGLAGRVMGFGDPIRHPFSNSLHIEMQVGDEGAVLFSRSETAAEFARTQGIILKGADKMERQLELQKQIAITEGTLGYFRQVEKAMADPMASTMSLGLLKRASPERQIYLQKAIRQTEEEIAYAKKLMVAPDEQKAKLGISGTDKEFNRNYAGLQIKLENYKKELAQPGKDVNFEKNIKDLENKYASYTKELADIRSEPGADIVPQGTGFYISKWEPINEKSKATRDLLVTTNASKTPEFGLIKSYLGWLRTPADTASKDSNINALIGAYGNSTLLELAQAETKEISKLGRWTIPGTDRRQRWLDFKRTLEANQKMMHPTTGERGYLFQNIPELEHFYLTTFDRLPNEMEKSAYFAYQRYVEMDAMHRELTIYKNKSIIGTESHRFSFRDKNGNRILSDYVDGIVQQEFPGGDSSILITGAGVRGLAKVMTKAQMSSKLQETLKEEVATGQAKIIRIYDPEARPLAKDPTFKKIVGDSRVRYIISREVDTKPLSFKQLTNRSAGHLENDHAYTIQQANVKLDQISGFNWYEGGKTVLGTPIRTMANDVLQKMERVRVLLYAGKEAEAELVAKKLPFNWETHSGWYKETRSPGGDIIPPVLRLDLPLHVVPKGKTIIQMDKTLENRFINARGENTFRDGTKLSSDARQYQVQSPGTSDSHEILTVTDKGSRGNPLYSYENAPFIDPITSMNRATKRLSHSTFMDDYKTYAVEHWLQEAKEWLKGTEEEIYHAPLHYFHNGSFIEGIPLEIRNRLEASRFKSQQIMGTPSTIDAFLHSMSQKLADSIYSKVGPTQLDPSWMIPKLTDANRFIRAVTYNMVIGMLSPVQIATQSITYLTIAGIEGARLASIGAAGGFLHQLSRINSTPEILKGLDKIASSMGYKPGEWLEARSNLMKTGFRHVGAEHAFLDNPLSGKVISNAGSDLLNIGQIFFREPEKNIRFASWYTAHKKLRESAPTGALSQDNIGYVLDRADLLAGNMSSAHKSLIQRGPLAFTTQFLSYNLRLAELMIGKRLTPIEKIRLFSTYGAVFGVSAFGLAGFPAGDIMRKEAIKNGYTGELDHLSTWMMEGIPSAMLQMATGKSYNIGQKFGNVGIEQLREALSSDKPMLDILGGASYSNFKGMFELSDGFRSHMGSLLRNSDEYFPLTQENLTDPLKRISTVNITSRLTSALSTGNWMSQKGQLLDKDVSPMAAILMSATGVQPQRVGDIRNLSIIAQEKKDKEQKVEEEFIKIFGKYSRAVAAREPGQVTDYGKQMRAVLVTGGYPYEKYGALIARAAKGNESLVNNMERSLYTRDIDPTTRDVMTEAYKKRLQMQQGNQ